MGDFHEYDPDQHDCLFALVPMSGYAEDAMVTIEEDEDAFTIKKGVDGAISRSKNLGQTALVTVHLMSTSKSNATLSGLHEQDRLQPGGAGVAPILIRDRNGTSVFSSDKAWIEKRPTVTRGKEATPREWKIRVINYAFFEGGT
jgi:hypothetical protein